MTQRDDDEDEDLGVIPNRIKELRKALGMTAAQLAERTGYSTGHINNIENLKKGFTPKSLKKIAKALGVTPAQLLDTSNAWQEVPLLGYVGDRGIIRPAGENGHQKPHIVRVPLAVGDVIALKMQGLGLYPRYEDGTIIICTKEPVPPDGAVGHECFVVMPDGISMIRHVDRGSGDETYNLTMHNQPPMLNVEVLNFRRVVQILPPA